MANLTQWIGHETETALNWQIVSFDDDPETWLDAPVLYLASDERMPWPDIRKLKRYLDLGRRLRDRETDQGRDGLSRVSCHQK